MPENDVIKNKDLLGKEAQAIPVPEKEIGIDVNDEFANLILNAATNSLLDINSIDGLSNVAQTREMLYTLIDTMGNDDTIAAVLETYAEDVVDTNDDGRVVWCESDDADIAKYINLLLDELNVDKNMYKWVYALVKYGDLYLKLFRQDEYGEDVLFETDKEEKKDRRLNESKETDDIETKEKLEESVKFHINTNNDPYATYVEAVANPGEMFELTRFGKTMGYIQAPVTVQQVVNQDSMLNQYINYKMKKKDVDVYGAQDFVHAALRDDVERAPEEIDIFNTDEDYDAGVHGGKYRVRRGQSLLASSFKVWRELTLLENSMLMNRLTRSAIVRILSMDVGEMPQNKVRDVLGRLKSLLEQKTAYKKDGGISEYTNPGPMENIILLPSHGTQGVVNSQTLGGDVNVKDIVDVDHFQDKLFGSLRVPKQYFCLHPDTELPLLDGTYPTIKEMYDNKDNYIGKGILSCNEDGELVPTKITDIMLTRKDASFVKITLDNGESLIVTPDHRIMLRDGSYKEAQDLEEGQSLMPYYEKINNKGRKLVLDNKSGKYQLQYRLVAEEKFDDIPKGNQIHHIDSNKLNDDFDNLESLTLQEHYAKHEKMLHRMNNVNNRKKPHGNIGKFSVTDGLTNMWLNEGDAIPEGFHKGQTCKYSEEGLENLSKKVSESRKGSTPWNKGLTAETSEILKNLSAKVSETRKQRFAEGKYDEATNRQRLAASKWSSEHREFLSESSRSQHSPERWKLERTLRCPVCGKVFRKNLNEEEYNNYLNKDKFYYCSQDCYKICDGRGKLSNSYKYLKDLDFNYSSYEEKRGKDCHLFKSDNLLNIIEKYDLLNYVPECNHRVIKVEKLNIIADAYDIEVESSNHNFPVKSGIFVHNCLTDDSTGFNGGTSLTIISSRYGKSIKRIQNTMCNMITDLVNLFLINRGLDNHVNNFTIKMQPPITQEELDRRENMRNRMGVNNDIMSQVSTYVKDDLINAKILKSLLSNTVSDPEVINLIQEYIDELEAKKEENPKEETDNENETPITSEEPFGEEPPRPTPMERGLEEPEFGGEEPSEEMPEEGEESYLPSFDEMGINGLEGEE